MYNALIELLNFGSEYNSLVLTMECVLVTVFVIAIINLLYKLILILFKRG